MIQLDSLIPHPNNPRVITAKELAKLKNSIKDFAKMMEARPIVYEENRIILGGNQRYKALLALGYTEIPDKWATQVLDWTDEEKQQFLIKDNISAGDWDWKALSEWDDKILGDWGLEDNKRRKGKLDVVDFPEDEDDLLETIKLKDSGVGIMKQHDLRYFAAFRTQKGVDIKGIKRQIPPARLLSSTIAFLRDFISDFSQVALVTTPARNSTAEAGATHFATECCKHLAKELGCEFYDGVFCVANKTKKGGVSRSKFAPMFDVNAEKWESIKQPIILMFDDVLTTGKTLLGLLPLIKGRNVFYFILMNNN